MSIHIHDSGKGRPPALKQRIAQIMSDGRPRTYGDLSDALGIVTHAKINSMEAALRAMCRVGILSKTYLHGNCVVQAIPRHIGITERRDMALREVGE